MNSHKKFEPCYFIDYLALYKNQHNKISNTLNASKVLDYINLNLILTVYDFAAQEILKERK